jgi:hypothetical protein
MTHHPASWLGTLKTYTLLIALTVFCVWLLFGKPHGLRLLQPWLTSCATTVNASPIIVTQLQSLNRLETASQVNQQVVEASADREHFPAFLGKDRLLMQVQTEMIAGIDMSRLTSGDVQVQGKTVTVRVPAPELFSVRIDDEHSKVFSRERGWLVFTPDINLEGQARLKVLADARATGQAYLLPTARTNAEANLRHVLATMGFATVKICWNDQSAV